MAEQAARRIAPAQGKLGVLCVGLGAVASTFVAGVENVRRGRGALPIGSLTQLGTIRLGKRTDNRSPLIKDLVPLARLEDLEFGGWDVYPDSAYEAAKKAGVLEDAHLQPLKGFLDGVKPWPAVLRISSSMTAVRTIIGHPHVRALGTPSKIRAPRSPASRRA